MENRKTGRNGIIMFVMILILLLCFPAAKAAAGDQRAAGTSVADLAKKTTRNRLDNISPKPTKKAIKDLGAGWDIQLKSIERTAEGDYVCEFYLLNGIADTSGIERLALWVGENGYLLVKKEAISDYRIICKKGEYKIFSITFSGENEVFDTNPLTLPERKDSHFDLHFYYGGPSLVMDYMDHINPAPTKKEIKATKGDWALRLKSVRRTSGGKYVCQFYLINGVGSSKYIRNLKLSLYIGQYTVAENNISKFKISCDKGECKIITVTFEGDDVKVPVASLDFQKPGRCSFTTIGDPVLVCKDKIRHLHSDEPLTLEETGELLANEMLKLINQERKALNLPSMKMDADLKKGAEIRAKEIVKSFSHIRPSGQQGTSVNAKARSENIQFGGKHYNSDIKKTATTFFNFMKTSQAHWSKVINASYKTIGICAYLPKDYDNNTGYTNVYWVYLFGN